MYAKWVRFLFITVGLIGLVGVLGKGGQAEPRMALAAAQASGLTYRWHAFHGIPDSNGEAYSVATDTAGNVYFAGYNDKTYGSPLHAYSGARDIMIMKLDAQGKYQWHTFYGCPKLAGSDGDDEAAAITVDSSGNLYVTGYSDETWQGPGAVDPLLPHGGDAEYMFVLKLNSSGAYQWHTFFQPGRAKAIDVDSSGVYAAGVAAAVQGTPLHTGGSLVALKFNSSGAYQWHTSYGSTESTAEETAAYGIVGDAAHNAVYVTGQSPNTWPGDENKAPLHDFSGGSGFSTDVVVLKLNGAGAYQWHTFYGAADISDSGYGIDVDGSGDPYLAGISYATWGSPLHTYSDEGDIAVLKLSGAGAYQWHTFYGSGAYDGATGIVVDATGQVYVVGNSSGAGWLGDGGAQPAHPHSEDTGDIAVLKLNASGAFQRHTFYGASDTHDNAQAIAINANHNLFITGTSITTWQGDGGTLPLHAHSGNMTGDRFVLRLDDAAPIIVAYKLYVPVIIR